MDTIRSSESDPTVIVQAADMGHELALRWHRTIPRVVFINKHFIKEQIDCVSVDNIGGSYLATSFLIDKGYTQIGHLKGRSFALFQNLQDRERGYLQALRDHNLEDAGTFLVHTSYQEAYEEMKQYLSQGVRFPRALVCDGDRQAMGVCRALLHYKIRIPEEVAVIGFDDLPGASENNPPLTTLRVSWEDMGRLAVERVLNKTIQPDGHCRKIHVGVTLVPRASS